MTTLSGGNQPKGRAQPVAGNQPSVLILDEPTQGIDVGAKAEIHAHDGELASQGRSDLDDFPSELPEILLA